MQMPSAVYSPGFVLAHAEEAKLTQEQIQKIQQDMYATREKMIDLRARAMKAKLALRRMLAEPKADQKAVDREIDAAADAMAEARKLQIQLWLRTRDLLTPDQRKQFAQLRADAWAGSVRWRRGCMSK
jgi:Spy/CpxP family protein refolding chaperone